MIHIQDLTPEACRHGGIVRLRAGAPDVMFRTDSLDEWRRKLDEKLDGDCYYFVRGACGPPAPLAPRPLLYDVAPGLFAPLALRLPAPPGPTTYAPEPDQSPEQLMAELERIVAEIRASAPNGLELDSFSTTAGERYPIGDHDDSAERFAMLELDVEPDLTKERKDTKS